MRCPFCAHEDSQVKDSRPTEDGAIRRRRVCSDCGGRFTTFERVQLRELTIAKIGIGPVMNHRENTASQDLASPVSVSSDSGRSPNAPAPARKFRAMMASSADDATAPYSSERPIANNQPLVLSARVTTTTPSAMSVTPE